MSRRRSRGSGDGGGGGAPEWMTTYSDLVTLLLCFFVLLFSFSSIDAGKFRTMMNSFKGGTGVFDGGTMIEMVPGGLEYDIGTDGDMAELLEELEEYSSEMGLGEELVVQVEERGIVIRFMDNIFFDSGSAEIKRDSMQILETASELLNGGGFKERQIKVEGHTDSDRIVRSSAYPTNWELSSARATNVLRYLVEVGGIDGGRISSSGYSYYRPIANNDTPENKAKNRRVDIIILKDVYQDLEP